MMNDHENHETIHTEGETLFDLVISILEQARGNVVRSVNSNRSRAFALSKKLDETGSKVETVRGVGYRLKDK